ncbi:hypothetical protein VTK26DRAFT_4942 [Humicola hyalothermophila]
MIAVLFGDLLGQATRNRQRRKAPNQVPRLHWCSLRREQCSYSAWLAPSCIDLSSNRWPASQHEEIESFVISTEKWMRKKCPEEQHPSGLITRGFIRLLISCLPTPRARLLLLLGSVMLFICFNLTVSSDRLACEHGWNVAIGFDLSSRPYLIRQGFDFVHFV